MSKGGFHRSGLEWFSSLPACLLLLAVVIFSTSSDIHNQMLRGGEQLWSGYYKLRMDPVQPTCDPTRDIDAAVAEEMAADAETDDPMAALLGAEEKDPADVRLAIERAVADCREAHQNFENLSEQLTPGVKAYRAIELFIADLIAFGRPYITNPDLPERFKNNWPLNPAEDMSLWYTPGPKGYTDYGTFKA